MNKFRFFVVILTTLLGCNAIKTDHDAAELEIRSVMLKQEQCWNNADLECFMIGYLETDSLVFVGRRGLTHGWQSTLDNYKKSYPDPQAMGKLKFELIKFTPLGKEHILVIGKYTLTRQLDEPSGYFSLVWQKIAGKWVIIADHSS